MTGELLDLLNLPPDHLRALGGLPAKLVTIETEPEPFTVGFDDLRPGWAVYRGGEVWIVQSKRSDGWLLFRHEDDRSRTEWVEAAGERWHSAEPF